MSRKERLTRQEAIKLAVWLGTIPSLGANVDLPPLAEDQSEDKGTGNSWGTDGSRLPELGPLRSMGSWQSVAATIVRKSQQIAGFDPIQTEFNPMSWAGYLDKLSTAPFWITTSSQNREVRISALSLSKTIDAIEDIIKTIASEPMFNSVVTSIKKIATVAINSEGKKQKDNMQLQGLISIKASKMIVANIWTSVQMEYKSGKGYEQLTQELNVQRWYGQLDFDKCKRSAQTILSWDKTDVEEWEKGTSSAKEIPNESPAWNQ